MSNTYDICLIGLGPAGVGFLSSLNDDVLKNTICFEKGTTSTLCTCHTETESLCTHCDCCNIISGLGGASRFSCGKISNFPAGSGLQPFFDSSNELIDFMNSEIEVLKKTITLQKVDVSNTKKDYAISYFNENDITYKYYDVYEFKKDSYIKHLTNIVSSAQRAGLQVAFNTEIIQIKKVTIDNEDVYIITAKSDTSVSTYHAKKVVVATGNINNTALTNDFYDDSTSSYEIGIRLSVPTDKIVDFLDFHGDLKLKYKNGRTYCVSKNGFVIAYDVHNLLFLEGYIDNDNPSNTTNFAIIFKYDNQNDLNAFKQQYKNRFNGVPIKQTYSDYLRNVPSDTSLDEKYVSVQNGNIRTLFSDDINNSIVDFINSVLINALKLKQEDLMLFAPELKESKNLPLDNNFQIAQGLYVIGAATGKFRGILQSLCSGIHCAQTIRR